MIRTLMVLLCLAVASPILAQESAIAKKVAEVESGLRPANSFRGESAWTLEERMAHYGVPGVGIAVIEDSEVVWFRVYGLADRETGAPVVPETLFQAGSISKPVAAFGALKLVEQGELVLNGPVNDKLTSWKIPSNEFTEQQACAPDFNARFVRSCKSGNQSAGQHV